MLLDCSISSANPKNGNYKLPLQSDRSATLAIYGNAHNDQAIPTEVGPAALVGAIRGGVPGATERLYKFLQGGIRFLLSRKLPYYEIDDRLHDTFLIVLKAILDGRLRQPDHLFAFARTVALRQIAEHIRAAVEARSRSMSVDEPQGIAVVARGSGPEGEVMMREQVELVADALAQLSEVDREILRRFYLEYQDPDEICREMHLTSTQFRLRKSRAKARLAAAAQTALRMPSGEPGRKQAKPVCERIATMRDSERICLGAAAG